MNVHLKELSINVVTIFRFAYKLVGIPVFFLMVLFLLLSLFPVSLITPTKALENSWYNSNWKYRKLVTIDNIGNASTLTNYQTKVTLTSSNFDFTKAQSSGADIRFTDIDGTSLLNYWIESYSSSGQTATVWVKISSILASSTKTIYVYYGNPSVSSASSADNTFLLYDNFNTCGLPNNLDSFSRVGMAIPPGSSESWDERVRERMSVLYDSDAGIYKAWYSGHKVTGGEATSEIGYATSPDGVTWTKYASNPVLVRAAQDQDPSVLKIGSTYYMYTEHTVSYTINGISEDLFTSTDGISWTAYPGNPIKTGAASGFVWKEDSTWYMMYENYSISATSNDINLATSTDGITWIDSPSNPIIVHEESGAGLASPDSVYKDGSTYHFYYHTSTSPTQKHVTSTNLTSWSTPQILYPKNVESLFPIKVGNEIWAYAWHSGEYLRANQPDVINGGFHLFKGYKDSNCLNTLKWDLVQRGVNSAINFNPDGIELSPYANSISSVSLKSKITFSNNIIIEIRKKLIGSSYSDVSLGSGNIVDADDGGTASWWHTTLQSGYLWLFNHQSLANSGVVKVPSAGGVNWASYIGNQFKPGTNIQANFETHKLIYAANGNISWYVDDTQKANGTDTDFLNSNKYLLISQGEYSNGQYGGQTVVDWVRVRTYTSIEPTVTFGIEENVITSLNALLVINSGNLYTNSTTVNLSISDSNVPSFIATLQLQISNDLSFTGAVWENYSASKSWMLTSGEGTKNVYIRLKDAQGNISSTFTGSIYLDITNPTEGAQISPPKYSIFIKPILVFTKFNDLGSGVKSYTVTLDSGKQKSYSISDIPPNGNGTANYLWKDDSIVKVQIVNENDSNSSNDRILVYFKGLTSNVLSDGNHTWSVKAFDKAGNTLTLSFDFNVTRLVPTTTTTSNKVLVTVIDSNGKIIVGAKVNLDSGPISYTDSNGAATFIGVSGIEHSVVISYGNTTLTKDISLLDVNKNSLNNYIYTFSLSENNTSLRSSSSLSNVSTKSSSSNSSSNTNLLKTNIQSPIATILLVILTLILFGIITAYFFFRQKRRN